jgi:hypothetical protein
MRGPASAFTALGLEPGADRSAVEQAYRRLIKLHHPDRSGGDPVRAAEINRAYFELRKQVEPEVAVPSTPHIRRSSSRRRSHRRRRRRSPLWALPAVGGLLLLVSQREWLMEMDARWNSWISDVAPPALKGPTIAVRDNRALLDRPLAEAAIAGAIVDAVRLTNQGDAQALAEESRDCHRRFRAEPELELFDRCAAFENAVAAIENRDPLQDSGAFNASSVTARQMTAASLLSNDYLAIESRLNRIRSRVELTLLPRAAMPPPAAPGEAPQETAAE